MRSLDSAGASLKAQRVVITGIGLVSSIGVDRDSTWSALLSGESGARWLNRPRLGPGYAGYPLARPKAWSSPPLSPEPYESDPVHRFLLRAADEAMLDARLVGSGLEPDRAASLVGLSKGGFRSLSEARGLIRSGEFDSPELADLWMRSWPSSGASLLAERYDFRGPCVAPVAACATGLVAALQASDLICRGVCDVALVGGADASLEPILLGAFRRMKVLARVVEDDPARAVRPWDQERSGFLVGEGGAVLVLERLDHALARGAKPYAELLGGAIGSDAYHETALNPDPTGLADVITRALHHSGLEPHEVDAVNVHGTATLVNDPLECQSLRLAFGSHAARLACCANKAQIGHLLGAAGAVELAIAALTVRDRIVPPTLNLDQPDPACDLDGTPHNSRPLPIRGLLKLSLGFGGHLAALVLHRVDDR